MWPEKYSVLAHQLIAADTLGDDSFLAYISSELKLPVGRINSSNRTQNVKMAVRDKYKLSAIVELKQASHQQCFACKLGFLAEGELTSLVACCGRMFHRSCLMDVKVCPYCNEPWGSLPCCQCEKDTCIFKDRFLHGTFERRRSNRMSCCGADIHHKCRQFVHGSCPACGEGVDTFLKHYEGKESVQSFVYRRRELRRNEAKRRRMGK